MEDLFIQVPEIPKNINKKRNHELLKTIYLKESREEMIENNIKLVIYQVVNKFGNVNYDKKDLVSIGIIGLIKAVDTFKLEKKVEFSSYAIQCINNEILMFLRKLKKEQRINSLYQCINDNEELELIDVVTYDESSEENYINKEEILILRKVIDTLPDKEQEFIKMYFGFRNKIYTQKEIGKKFNISQAQVSRIISIILGQIKNSLEILDIDGNSRYKKIVKKLCNTKRLTD